MLKAMEEGKISLIEIKKRIISSFFSLTARQIALRTISFVTLNLVLAKILPVETLGIFNIATAVITFFAFFSDIGLAASLIQKKEEITEHDVATVFTIQQSLVVVLSLIIVLGAPLIGSFYRLDDAGVWLVRFLGIGFFLSSLKVVPSVMLERNLRFQPLVMVEVVETLLFNLLLIILVIGNLGIWAFSWAALVRGLVGTCLIYLLSPVKIRLGIDRQTAKNLLTFGVPYQANSILAMIKDRLVPLVIARMVGATGIGYITWAQTLAFLPLEIMNVIVRITFPAYSRLQDDSAVLSRAVEKSLFITSAMVYPILFGIAALLPSLVVHVVSSKWQPAVSSFYLFAFSTYWAVISTTLTNTLNAIGHIKTTLKLMVMWTALTWFLTPILVWWYGFIGVGLASFLISFTSVVTIILVKRILPLNILQAILLPTVASAVMGIAVYCYAQLLVQNIFSLIMAVVLGGAIYTSLLIVFKREFILASLKNIRNV